MVASGTWTDPKTGANYAFGDKLPSADVNSWAGGIRTIDQNVVMGALSTFPHRLPPATGYHLDAAMDTYGGALIMVGSDGATNAQAESSPDMHAVLSTGMTSGTGYQADSVDADASGNIVAGLSGIGTSTDRIRTSQSAGSGWAVRNLPTVATSVEVVIWSGTLFVAGYDPGAATNRIATSPTGTTWTDRTNPLSNNFWSPTSTGGAVTDGAGKVVLIPLDAGSSAFAYSADGLTWSSASTTAASWATGAYSPGFGWIAYSGDGATIWSSSDGSAWAAATGKTLPAVPTGFTAVTSVAAVGNVLAMLWNDGTSSFVSLSADWGVTWGTPVLRFGAEILVFMRASGGRIIVIDNQGNEYTFVSSRVIV